MPSSVLPAPSQSSDFSIINLPYGICYHSQSQTTFPCTRVGDYIINLPVLVNLQPSFPREVRHAFTHHNDSLNLFMSLSKSLRRSARQVLIGAVKSLMEQHKEQIPLLILPVSQVEMRLPCQIGDYSDFYASRHHAVNAGTIFRSAQNALQPNWLHLPVGYHGRSSSIVISGTPIVRPCGQLDEGKTYGPCRKLDYELEIGVFLAGPGNEMGNPVSVDQARDMIFGYVLLNDWSARDVQAWEYVPLGPFCAKNFATSISPWIVPAEAFEFCLSEPVDSVQSPDPLPYLRDNDYRLPNITLTASLTTRKTEELTICKTNMKNLYWTPAQMICHHTSTGCNMRAGDLIGTGTISGPLKENMASLLELSWNGQKPITLGNGESRSFLQDGDGICIRGWAEDARNGGLRVGFGECVGMVLPAKMGKL